MWVLIKKAVVRSWERKGVTDEKLESRESERTEGKPSLSHQTFKPSFILGQLKYSSPKTKINVQKKWSFTLWNLD